MNRSPESFTYCTSTVKSEELGLRYSEWTRSAFSKREATSGGRRFHQTASQSAVAYF